MSKPRGNRVQRAQIAIAKEVFEPFGCAVEADFSTNGKHHKVVVSFPDGGIASLEIVSSPRSEGNALCCFRQGCRRELRSRGLG